MPAFSEGLRWKKGRLCFIRHSKRDKGDNDFFVTCKDTNGKWGDEQSERGISKFGIRVDLSCPPNPLTGEEVIPIDFFVAKGTKG
mgnify:CR=1 FL=1